jgi:hypothetical protein
VVAGEHDYTNPRVVTPAYGCSYPGAERVAYPQESKGNEPARIADRDVGRTFGYHEHTQTTLGKFSGPGEQFAFPGLVQGTFVIAPAHAITTGD